MRSIDQLLDDLKAAKGLKSDYALAKHLGVVSGSVQNWRHKRTLPDPQAITKIALELGIDADVLLLEIEAQRSRTEYSREAWLRIAQRLQGGAAPAGFMLALAVSLLVGVSPRAEASPLPFDQVEMQGRAVHYVKRLVQMLRRLMLGWPHVQGSKVHPQPAAAAG